MAIVGTKTSDHLSKERLKKKREENFQYDYESWAYFKSLFVCLESFPLRNLSEVNWDTREITSRWL